MSASIVVWYLLITGSYGAMEKMQMQDEKSCMQAAYEVNDKVNARYGYCVSSDGQVKKGAFK